MTERYQTALAAVALLSAEERDDLWLDLYPPPEEPPDERTAKDDGKTEIIGFPKCMGAAVRGPDGCTCRGPVCTWWATPASAAAWLDRETNRMEASDG